MLTMAKRRPKSRDEALKVLDQDDHLVRWEKPLQSAKHTPEEWAAVADEITVREIKVEVQVPGFRTREFHIVTTLLDPVKYPAKKLAELYLRRWDVELFFRDIKITLGMELLRSRTPEMVRKEIVSPGSSRICRKRSPVSLKKKMVKR